MRVGFFGTPELAGQYLRALAEKHQVVAVVTQPDRPCGRSGKPAPCAVKVAAQALGVPVIQPQPGHCREACEQIQAQGAQVCVVVAFGQKLPCGTPDFTGVDYLNVHYSLLPLLRGAAPVEHAILQGLDETGVTIQYVGSEWDAGDILLQEAVPIHPDDTAGSLTQRLTEVGIPLLLRALELVDSGQAVPRPQDHERATYAPALHKSDALINWEEPAETIARKVRAFNPRPVAWSLLRGRPLRILRAHAGPSQPGEGISGEVVEASPDIGLGVRCGEGTLWLEEVQAEGRKPLPVPDYLRGSRLRVGERLG